MNYTYQDLSKRILTLDFAKFAKFVFSGLEIKRNLIKKIIAKMHLQPKEVPPKSKHQKFY